MNNFISYKQWLNEADITPSINRHMTHAEDLVILGGKKGLNWVVNTFKELYKKFESNTEEDKIRLSVKFDGAPSVFVWSKFPGLQRAGLAIKGLFAKDRKIMYNNEDIDHFYNDRPDLAKKLKLMLYYLPAIKIPENQIWQGDFLYDKDTLIEDKGYYIFHPNTIVYKVPINSKIGDKIKNTDIGIVWHTRYIGSSLDNIQAKYDTKVSILKENSKVFMTDPYIASLAGYITLTEEEKKNFIQDINKIEKHSQNLYKLPEYYKIIEDDYLIDLFKIFQNSLIRENIKVDNSKDYLNRFIDFVNKRFKKNILLKKTEKAQKSLKKKLQEIIEKIETYQNTFLIIIDLILEITLLKNMFIKKLNNISKFETYLKTNSGKFLSTGQEGFAVSDIHGNVVKLVDRYEFSFANFSPKIIKGWTK